MRQTWMSPRIFMPSGSWRVTPPTMHSSSAFFTSSCPKISGARLAASLSYTSLDCDISCNNMHATFNRPTPSSPLLLHQKMLAIGGNPERTVLLKQDMHGVFENNLGTHPAGLPV